MPSKKRSTPPKESTTIEVDETLDLTGLYCPEPLLQTRLKMDEIEQGKVVEILADDPAAEEDLKVLCRNMGYTLVDIKKEDTVFHFFIKKT